MQLVNTFQAVLATDGTRTFVLFLYEDIQWGSSLDSSTATAIVGFNAGDGGTRSFRLPDSLTDAGILNLESASNIGIPGTFIFRVDQDVVPHVPRGIMRTVI